MRILIVDDQNDKANDIVNSILMCGKIKREEIITVPSINDAISKLVTEKYDLMIVDMCIPEVYPGMLQNDGGLKLITIINSDKRIITPNEIIVLTAHEHLFEEFKDAVKKKSFDIITYNSSSEEWKRKINDKLEYLIVWGNSPGEERKFKYDVAILTAVSREKAAVEQLSESWKRVPLKEDSTVYYECIWEKGEKQIKVVTTSLMQMGMVPAAAISTKMIYNFSPRYLIMPGIAGGVKDEYEIGDIIVPREVKDYCSGKYATPNDKEGSEEAKVNPLKYFIPTATSISTDTDIINKFGNSFREALIKIHSQWTDNAKYIIPTIRNGYMASGDSVVQNSAVIDTMIKNHLRNADALDMEAYGMYYAAQQAIKPKPTPICMKAISDFANKEKLDDYQAYAAYVSAQFMKYFILNELSF